MSSHLRPRLPQARPEAVRAALETVSVRRLVRTWWLRRLLPECLLAPERVLHRLRRPRSARRTWCLPRLPLLEMVAAQAAPVAARDLYTEPYSPTISFLRHLLSEASLESLARVWAAKVQDSVRPWTLVQALLRPPAVVAAGALVR
jgi:hypothetical protein